ncbi:Xanthine phosphoribosyltransferase 1 [Podila minutissima]|nr:Xanthine phosphoribosyltransferase 1 [Podila minutissima]
MKTSPRCLVVSLSIAFFAFNWLVYHAFQGRTSSRRSSSSSSSSSQKSPTPSNLPLWKQPHGQPWTVPSNHTSHQQEPSWLGNWLRWRGLDPGYDEAHSTEQLKFDVVYTWVNGSDADLQLLRHEYQSKSPLFQLSAAGDTKTIESVTTKRFRDMDELRYSVRSVAQYASSTYRRIHILSTESRPGQAQTPYWLKTALDGSTEGELRVVPHRAMFADSADLPSFNSLAIESQMRNIPGLSDVFIYMNDDVFVGRTMMPSDIWTSLYGFVFHMEASLLIPPTIRPVEANPLNVGEWSSLQYSNFLLSGRFGPRWRAYLAHVTHVLSVPMLNEIYRQWPLDFNSTSSHRFRGEGEAKDIHVSFFMAHYVMEMLRETQLESYWQYRLDANQDGVIDYNERQALLDMVKSWNQNQDLPQDSPQRKRHSRPTILDGHKLILHKVGMQMSGSTDYRYAGLDGFPFMIPTADTSKTIPLLPIKTPGSKPEPQLPYKSYEKPQERTCQLNADFCFGPEFMDTNRTSTLSIHQSQRIFERIAKSEFHCGDCLLELLMQHPSNQGGMSAILPKDERSEAFQRVIRKLARYNYVLGTSTYWFIALQGPEQSRNQLKGLTDNRANIAYFCINDDFPNDLKLQTTMQGIFRGFLDERFPLSSPWERPGSLPAIPGSNES